VLVGDYCVFGSQSGTVEDIGLRSTRIRTTDRTVVTIPNSVFSGMTIENFAKRDRIWFHPTLRLRRDTPAEKVREMIDAIGEILRNEPLVQAPAIPVRFTKITDSSLDLELFAYVGTADYDQFLKVQTSVLLKFLEAGQTHGVEWSVPLTDTFSVNRLIVDPTTISNFHPDGELPAGLPKPD
jgi:MscS family membrane protein